LNLDHNAGGRVRPEVARAVAELLESDLGNPSSAHHAGRRARAAIEEARAEVAALVGARPSEVVFTSGGTEANNWAVLGTARPSAHLVSTAIEHVSVLRALERAEAEGARVTLVAPAGDGLVSAETVAEAISPTTALVSVGWANGEIGTLQPIGEIVAAVRERRGRGALIHSDAVQAAGLVEIAFEASDVDLLSLAGHKIGALPGVGVLVVREGTRLRPALVGGPQERERRAGTENLSGIVSFGVAARLARAERAERARSARALVERLWQGLAQVASPVLRLGRPDGLPTTLCVAFPGVRGDALVVALDLAGIAASTGSACAAGAAERSHVVRSLGLAAGAGALRLSLGREIARADVDRAVEVVAAAVARARGASTAGARRAKGVSDAA
jgi:cysteine desulfurase